MSTKRAPKPKNPVAPTETGSVAVMPDFLKKDGPSRGTENLRTQDVELPRVALLQATSDQVGDPNIDATAGRFWHTVEEYEIGPEFTFTPIVIPIPNYILWKPLHQGGGILARAMDGIHWTPPDAEFRVKPVKNDEFECTWRTAPTVAASGLDNFGSSDPRNPASPPASDLNYNYICVSPSHPKLGVFLLKLHRTALTAGKRLNALLKSAECDSFGLVIHVSSFWDDKGPDNKKFIYKFKRHGWATPEDYVRNEILYNNYSGLDVVAADEEATQREDAMATEGGGPKEY